MTPELVKFLGLAASAFAVVASTLLTVILFLVRRTIGQMDDGQERLLKINREQTEKIDRITERVGQKLDSTGTRLSELEKATAVLSDRVERGRSDINGVGQKLVRFGQQIEACEATAAQFKTFLKLARAPKPPVPTEQPK